ncbi:phenylacetate--CoA ligase family protein [Pseudoalteromonas sp. T1lg48]|uniref:phenylacetate--CoA ligase family protein n=1 Tax=Pseudoalteromonas sp. T1lg48 TaxID=2077100 RepID=UPI000CF73BD4|nr:phenylacetate--CoA ligase family protein [Pseudoalteromonas sp. T1lg48]
MFYYLLYILGSRFRNPSLNKVYRELKETEFADSDTLKKIQEDKLRCLLCFCYRYSPYYRKKFNEISFNPESDVYDKGILSQIPLLSKGDLIKFNSDIHANYTFKKTFFSETSGSTGEALTFHKDELWDSYNRASINRGLSWFGVKPWNKNGYFWGFSNQGLRALKVKVMDLLVNRFRLFSYTNDEIENFLHKSKSACYLEGYSSMIYEVAKKANQLGIKLDNIKLVKGTSEKIYDHYHEETKKAFGQKIISEYGSAESGIIAFECPHGQMHLNEETCIVEEIEGRAVITNLVAYSFPTIRYDLGDYIKISDKPCACGRAHRVLEEVAGRVGKNIVGKNGELFPSLTLYYVFKNMALGHGLKLSYRCVQKKEGLLEVSIEALEDSSLIKALIKSLKTILNRLSNVNIILLIQYESKEKN